MIVLLTDESLQWFEANNISFHNRFKPRLRPGDKLGFGNALELEPYVGFHAGNVLCRMEFMSFSNSAVPPDLAVGRYCSIARGLKILPYRHPVEHVSTSIFTHDPETDLVVRAIRDHDPGYAQFFDNPQKGPVRIEHDVWIGQDVTLAPGITIGTGSVIAANSVVTRPVAPYEVVGGNPARLIKMRFSPEIVARLLASEWWAYKFTDFAGLKLDDPGAFLDAFETRKPALTRYVPPPVRVADVARYGRILGREEALPDLLARP